MTQSHEFRRHVDGSIDFDFYRAHAAAIRLQTFRDAFLFKSTSNYTLTPLITLILIAGVTIAASVPARWA